MGIMIETDYLKTIFVTGFIRKDIFQNLIFKIYRK